MPLVNKPTSLGGSNNSREMDVSRRMAPANLAMRLLTGHHIFPVCGSTLL